MRFSKSARKSKTRALPLAINLTWSCPGTSQAERRLMEIFSDETFCTQSQITVEKVPEFSAESLCLRQGMATSGRWCDIFQHYLTMCAACIIRNYVSRVQKTFTPKSWGSCFVCYGLAY